jgi:hypothetical protein
MFVDQSIMDFIIDRLTSVTSGIASLLRGGVVLCCFVVVVLCLCRGGRLIVVMQSRWVALVVFDLLPR